MNTKSKIRIAFTVIIHNKEYDVWRIEGKEHPGYNGEPNNWWLYYSERVPEGIEPPQDSPHWVPYTKSINRRLWDISFKQSNTSKIKYGDPQFSNHTTVEMRCNGQLIYSFGTIGTDSGLAFAMAKVQYLQVHLSEFPGFDFFDPQSNNGRKIYWFGLPAFVKVWRNDTPWEIGIVPDYDAGLSKKEWWKELKSRQKFIPPKNDDIDIFEEDGPHRDMINWGDALSDQHIDWFRK